VKTVALVVCLMAGVSLAEDRTVPAGAKPSQKAKIDPKTQQLMNEANEMDQHLQELKSCLNHERAMSGESNPAAAERQASDEQIQVLQRSIQQLRQQLESEPHYLDQTNKLRP
jgi:chromosome segregation ATPase